MLGNWTFYVFERTSQIGMLAMTRRMEYEPIVGN